MKPATRSTARLHRDGLTRVEVLIVLVVLAVAIALITAGVLYLREQSRLIQCRNNLKQIGLGILNYSQAMKAFPPGTISAYEPIQPGNQYDIWSEAAETGSGFHGTSFLPRIMPYIESGFCPPRLDFKHGISSTTEFPEHTFSCNRCNFEYASYDIPGFYCPSRREGFRPQDRQMMLTPAWTGGGTDYGGCAGRYAAFTLSTGYNLCDASTYYEPSYQPPPIPADDDNEEKRWGVFGRVNISTTRDEITDGLSNTIMTGELQRILNITPGSVDGWVIGGPATLFTTGAMFRCDEGRLECVASPTEGRLLNNKFFGSPGSAHAGGANFGLADGAVLFFSNDIDPEVFTLLGSMADSEKTSPLE